MELILRQERVVEIPWVEKRIKGKVILDVGCCESNFCLYLAKKGYIVYGVDYNDYDIEYNKDEYKNFKFVKWDVTSMPPFENEFFDTVYAISTLEHVGLGFYGDTVNRFGDVIAMMNIKNLTKKGGRILVTLPYGKSRLYKYKSVKDFYRVYDRYNINLLFDGLEILEMQGFKAYNGKWGKCDINDMEDMYWEGVEAKSIVCISAEKR